MSTGTGKTQVSIEEYQKQLAQRIHDTIMSSFHHVPAVKDISKAIGEPLTAERLEEFAHKQLMKELEPKEESPLMRHINHIMALRYGKAVLEPQKPHVKVEHL